MLWIPRAIWTTAKDWIKRPFYALYQRRLARKARKWRIPQHIGIIMDGNRRFARQYGYSDVRHGHAQGAEKLHDVLTWCYEFNVPVVTVWAFSTENFQRSADELHGLFDLFEIKFREIVGHESIHKRRVRVQLVGRRDMLPTSLQEAIRAAETATAGYDGLTLNVAIAYGGRQEITDACRQFMHDQAEQGRTLSEAAAAFDATAIDRYVYTAGQPEPDLIIRTSGEVRLSGFLLWQSVYSEFYFCDTFWPAFRKIDFLRALRDYHNRLRRFGK